jgi:hypothetical protein
VNDAIRRHRHGGIPDAAVAELLVVLSAWRRFVDHAPKRGLCLIVRERGSDE